MNAAEIDRWNRAQALLDEVLDSPGARGIQAARDRAAQFGIGNEFEALLTALDTASALDAPLEIAIHEMSADQLRHGALSGRVFGRWVLGDEIGRGGMSTVYRAQRTGDGFDQEAALKILSLTFASQSLIDSFVRERQILSELQHPGIARLIDGGITPEGSPFLVMEYVDGKRIDHWCAENEPDARRIVQLILSLAKAVAYAQKRLVIHRDINASNVLVNERGQPVLIDFGIAGLLGHDQNQTLHAFTPTFAAPEQVAGQRCTTATDVFAIGRLLQSLLAGAVVDKELQLLIDVATAADPERRYANARNLSDDLIAWLEKRPLEARLPTLAYRASRFISRHRWGVVAAVLLLVSLVGGLTTSMWQARIAAGERDVARAESARANQVTEFLKDLFRASDPDEAQGKVISARELLDQGAFQVRNAFGAEPELKTERLLLLGELYRELNETDAAEPLLQDALALAETLGDIRLRAESLKALSFLRMSSQSHQEALDLAEQAEQLLIESGAVPGVQHAALMHPLLFSLAELGRVQEAVDRGNATLDSARQDAGLSASALYDYLYNTANALIIAEREPDAEPLLLEALNLELDALQEPTNRIALLAALSSVVEEKGETESALRYLQQAVELTDLIYPPGHPERARQWSSLASLLNLFGRYAEAEQAARKALEIYVGIYSDEAHPRVAAAYNNLGRTLMFQGRFEDAIGSIALAREMAGELFGLDDPRYAIATGNLGDLYRQAGRMDEADELLQLNLELRRRILGPQHRGTGTALGLLAQLRLDQRQYLEALSFCDEALALFAAIDFQHPVVHIVTRLRRAQALDGVGRTDDAGVEYREILALSEAAGAGIGAARLDLLAAYAEHLLRLDDPQALDILRTAIDEHTSMLGIDHPQTQRLKQLATEHGLGEA